MDLTFDISEEELPIFQAEVDEHLQNLEEGLVRLEREESSPELVQAIFRSAHTLKGSAGMIGHKRMVEVTHALETVLDGVRKGNLAIVSDLIDAGLDAVDSLRHLSAEVHSQQASSIDIRPVVDRLTQLSPNPSIPVPNNLPQQGNKLSPFPNQNTKKEPDNVLSIRARISADSIASAARAFQLLMALQEMGQIINMQPDQATIETAAPVTDFFAQIQPNKPVDEIRKVLSAISELDTLVIGDSQVDLTPSTSREIHKSPSPEQAHQPLGELLVSRGLINPDQLATALEKLKEEHGPVTTLGQYLVTSGIINQEILDDVIAEQQRAKAARPKPVEVESPDKGHIKTFDKTVRTSVERLDRLMNLVGELITDRNRMYQLRREFEELYRGKTQVETLSETITHVGRITDMLQSEVMGIRMLPISNVFNKFPRLVRDLSQKGGKQIDLIMRGEDTELDRSVIEEISDPLIHLLRNSVDHGIESPEERRAASKPERGVILLTARHEQGRIIITVEDNGRGIDIEKVKKKAIDKGMISRAEADALTQEEAVDLIFLSGLSTAKVVSDVSGRGVGMDIVKNHIERLNGSIQVETWPGRGSQFQLVLPLTLAIVPTLLVKVNTAIYAIPLVTVTETLRIRQDEIHTVNNRPVIRLRDHVLPVLPLSEVFGFQSNNNGVNTEGYQYIVVVRSGKTQLGLIVDALVGEQEVVVKSLSSVVGEILGISSAAILGDGSVTLIVDVQGMFRLISIH